MDVSTNISLVQVQSLKLFATSVCMAHPAFVRVVNCIRFASIPGFVRSGCGILRCRTICPASFGLSFTNSPQLAEVCN